MAYELYFPMNVRNMKLPLQFLLKWRSGDDYLYLTLSGIKSASILDPLCRSISFYFLRKVSYLPTVFCIRHFTAFRVRCQFLTKKSLHVSNNWLFLSLSNKRTAFQQSFFCKIVPNQWLNFFREYGEYCTVVQFLSTLSKVTTVYNSHGKTTFVR